MSKVSRSTYQKLAEENKRLLKDIRLLTAKGVAFQLRRQCLSKWRKRFREESEYKSLLKDAAKRYVEKNADKLPDFLTKTKER